MFCYIRTSAPSHPQNCFKSPHWLSVLSRNTSAAMGSCPEGYLFTCPSRTLEVRGQVGFGGLVPFFHQVGSQVNSGDQAQLQVPLLWDFYLPHLHFSQAPQGSKILAFQSTAQANHKSRKVALSPYCKAPSSPAVCSEWGWICEVKGRGCSSFGTHCPLEWMSWL